MKRWACSYIDWFDNELTTKIVSATNWLEAFMIAYPDRCANITNNDGGPPETLEKAKENAFNCDSMIHVEEIPEV